MLILSSVRVLGVFGQRSSGVPATGAVAEGLYGCAGTSTAISPGRSEWMGLGIFFWGEEGMLIFAGLVGTETENRAEKYHQLPSHEALSED